MTTGHERPLDGVRILDLSRVVSGPYCTAMLARMGADVVKVEPPSGETYRQAMPMAEGVSSYWTPHNAGKRAITLDLRNQTGRVLLRRLASQADVVVENFRPGVMDEIGCGFDVLRALRHDLILVSISGFGQGGEQARRLAYDQVIQAESGIVSITGPPDQPIRPAVFVADYLAALYATQGVLLALMHRTRTGRGQWVDVSMHDAMLSIMAIPIVQYLLSGDVPERSGNRGAYTCPNNVYQAADGYVQISAGVDAHWQRLAIVIGGRELADDPRYRRASERMARVSEVDTIVGEWARPMARAAIMATLAGAEVACGEVRGIQEVAADPLAWSRGVFTRVQDGAGGDLPTLGVVPLLSDSPGRVDGPPPEIGQDNADVYREWLGLTTNEIDDMATQAVI